MQYDVNIQQQDFCPLFELQAGADALADWLDPSLPAMPDHPNTRTTAGGRTLCHVSPNRWIMRGTSAESNNSLKQILRADQAGPSISIVDISDAMTFFQLTGPDADQVMTIASPLDTHPTRFSSKAACFSEVFGIRALILKIDQGFDFAIDQSFAPMIADHLDRATKATL